MTARERIGPRDGDEDALRLLVRVLFKRTGEAGAECPEIGIRWPVKDPILSEKDARAQTLAQWLARTESGNFRY